MYLVAIVRVFQAMMASCGPGIYSVAMAARVHDVVGFDVSEEMIERAQQRALAENCPNCRFSVVDWSKADIET